MSQVRPHLGRQNALAPRWNRACDRQVRGVERQVERALDFFQMELQEVYRYIQLIKKYGMAVLLGIAIATVAITAFEILR